MKRKLQSITNALIPASAVILLLIIWQVLCLAGVLPGYMLPSPWQVVQAFVKDFPLMAGHMWTTLFEAFAGLGIGIVMGFVAVSRSLSGILSDPGDHTDDPNAGNRTTSGAVAGI